jgi:hypothetical protein
VAAQARYAEQLVHCLVCPIQDVAERTAVAHNDVERGVREGRQVEDVGLAATLDLVLQASRHEPLTVELELDWRDVDDCHAPAKACQLDRESARAGARIEHAIA